MSNSKTGTYTELWPAACEANFPVVCDWCGEKVSVLTFGKKIQQGVCGCPWTYWDFRDGRAYRCCPDWFRSTDKKDKKWFKK